MRCNWVNGGENFEMKKRQKLVLESVQFNFASYASDMSKKFQLFSSGFVDWRCQVEVFSAHMCCENAKRPDMCWRATATNGEKIIFAMKNSYEINPGSFHNSHNLDRRRTRVRFSHRKLNSKKRGFGNPYQPCDADGWLFVFNFNFIIYWMYRFPKKWTCLTEICF